MMRGALVRTLFAMCAMLVLIMGCLAPRTASWEPIQSAGRAFVAAHRGPSVDRGHHGSPSDRGAEARLGDPGAEEQDDDPIEDDLADCPALLIAPFDWHWPPPDARASFDAPASSGPPAVHRDLPKRPPRA